MPSQNKVVAYTTKKRPKKIKHIAGRVYAEICPDALSANGTPPEGVNFVDFLGIYPSRQSLRDMHS